MGRAWRLTAGAVALTATLAGGSAASSATASHSVARAAASQQCAGDEHPHNAANPLDLRTAPGSNPLRGARFFTAGPAYGPAAGAIAQQLGIDPKSYSADYSWAQFASSLTNGGLSKRVASDHGLGVNVHELMKIAQEPTPMRLSSFVYGGTPAGTAAETNKMFCTVLRADPGTVPIIQTYYLHPLLAGRTSRGAVNAVAPRFKAFIDELAAATGNHPVVFYLEEDALGTSSGWARAGSLGLYESLLRYEAQKLSALPHAVVYIEGGYSDSNTASYTAKALKAIGTRYFRGFYTDDTHFAWTINEINWAEQISRALHGLPYVVSTAQNGQGPIVPRNRVRDGNEVLCNPPNRGLGPRPTISPGGPAKHADAFAWVVQPGNSAGSCNGGTASGTFWTARAISLALHANERLGPRYHSQPY